MTARRIDGYGRVNRKKPLTFSWDGKNLGGFEGDTLASALLASNEQVLARSFKYHRPRGIMSAGVEESGALVSVGRDAEREPNVRATTQELFDGLVATGQNAWPNVRSDIGAINNVLGRFFAAGFYYKTFMGLPPFEWGRGTGMWMKYEKIIRRAAGMGRAAILPDIDRYERAHTHCDVLVVGSGPAGLAAATTAAREGLDVLLVEQDFEAGGSYLTNADQAAIDGHNAGLLALQELGVRVMIRTTAFGLYDNSVAGLLERVTDHQSEDEKSAFDPRQRCWTVRAMHTILASGALERGYAFANNDTPGIMTVGSANTYLQRYGILVGESVIVSTNNDSAYNTAAQLAKAGASVTVLDARPSISSSQLLLADENNLKLIFSASVMQAAGGKRIKQIRLARKMATQMATQTATQIVGQTEEQHTTEEWTAGETLQCDSLLVSGGWSPVVNLMSHRGIKPEWNPRLACFVPPANTGKISVAGAAAGIFDHALCIESGQAAGLEATRQVRAGEGREKGIPINLPTESWDESSASRDSGWSTPISPLYEVKPSKARVSGAQISSAKISGKSFIDPQHDVVTDDIRLAHQEGFVSVEHMKRYTTLGMATDQGKMGNIIGLALMADARGIDIPAVGTTTFRPPYTPITLGALQGEARGKHYRVTRRTPMHDWNLENGATMMAAGLWDRPWYFGHSGESLLETANRETLATRGVVGLCDVTSLGKIVVQGPDATVFLERIYCNNFASLPIGKARYGIMLRDDGMVMDDGTCWRLDEHEYFMTTTTAQAAHVMVWLEELLQVRWPDLRVHVSTATDQWAGIAVAGPRSRELLQAIASQPAALDATALPFMGVVETPLQNGINSRIARISFSGELAYEIYVPSDFGAATMQSLWQLAEPMGGCRYGIESLSTMRIEKGHVTGSELDGRVTLTDAGLGGMLSKKKAFIGSALLQRPVLNDPSRPRLVGIFPKNRDGTFNTGSILCQEKLIEGHGEGWVTGVAHSPSLGHWIGIGFVSGGFEAWQGKTLVAADPVRRANVEVEVVSPHMFDPKGERLHA